MSHYSEQNTLQNSFPTDEVEFNNLSEEIIPIIKTLVKLCESQGIYLKIINRSTVIRKCLLKDLGFDMIATHEATDSMTNLAYHNFGLAFGIAIYEKSAFGMLKYIDHKILYDKVGKIGESIGLTWAGNHPFLCNLRYFELRPHWAAHMSDKEMINEVYRRKEAKIALLA